MVPHICMGFHDKYQHLKQVHAKGGMGRGDEKNKKKKYLAGGSTAWDSIVQFSKYSLLVVVNCG